MLRTRGDFVRFSRECGKSKSQNLWRGIGHVHCLLPLSFLGVAKKVISMSFRTSHYWLLLDERHQTRTLFAEMLQKLAALP